MNTIKVRIRKQKNGAYLPTITKRQEEYFSPSNSAPEWLPYFKRKNICKEKCACK